MRTAFLVPFCLTSVATPAIEPKVHRDVPYAEPKHERQTLDVYSPADGKDRRSYFGFIAAAGSDGDTYDVPLQIATVEQRRADIYRKKLGTKRTSKRFHRPRTQPRQTHSAISHLAVADHPETKLQSERLAKALQAAGISVRVFPAEGKDHTTINSELSRPDDKPTVALDEFLKGNLKKRADPR